MAVAAGVAAIMAGTVAATGSIVKGVSENTAANRAKNDAREQLTVQRAVQAANMDREEFERKRIKDEKRAADIRAETEMRLAAQAMSAGGSPLGRVPGANTILGS